METFYFEQEECPPWVKGGHCTGPSRQRHLAGLIAPRAVATRAKLRSARPWTPESGKQRAGVFKAAFVSFGAKAGLETAAGPETAPTTATFGQGTAPTGAWHRIGRAAFYVVRPLTRLGRDNRRETGAETPSQGALKPPHR